jgi:hypothetical protein
MKLEKMEFKHLNRIIDLSLKYSTLYFTFHQFKALGRALAGHFMRQMFRIKRPKIGLSTWQVCPKFAIGVSDSGCITRENSTLQNLTRAEELISQLSMEK